MKRDSSAGLFCGRAMFYWRTLLMFPLEDNLGLARGFSPKSVGCLKELAIFLED